MNLWAVARDLMRIENRRGYAGLVRLTKWRPAHGESDADALERFHLLEKFCGLSAVYEPDGTCMIPEHWWRCGGCHVMQSDGGRWRLDSGDQWNGHSTKVCANCRGEAR